MYNIPPTCKHCNQGKMLVYNVKTIGSVKVRYLKCDECGYNDKDTVETWVCLNSKITAMCGA